MLLVMITLWSIFPLSSLEVQAYQHSSTTPLPAGAYKNWKQTDPRWSDVPIGIYPWYDRYGNYHYYNTIGHAGCYISSIAILCNAYGLTFKDGTEINPGTFGERLYDNGKCTYLTSDGSMYNSCTWCGTMIEGIEYYTTRWITSESNAAIAKLIAGYLNDTSAEYGVIVGVYDHFVAVDYVSGSSVYICDPGYSGRYELFSSYSRVYRLVVFKFRDNSKPPVPTYNVTYHANGGSQAPSAQTKTQGQSVTLHTEKPTRVGYTFLGWATSPTGSVVYQPGDVYTSDANLQLYAVWKERTDCEIWRVSPSNALNIRGGPSTANAIITALPASSEIAVTEIRLADGHIWGKVEEGWCALEYCTYVRGSLYTVKYDANGGSGAPASQPSSYGQSLTLRSTVPTRENYEFLGWSTDPNAAEPTWKPGASYTNLSASSITLYAVWQKVGSTVTYHANGGSNAPSSQRKPFGENITLTQKVPTRTGYDFCGWSLSADGEVDYMPGDRYTEDENLTLYAVWKVQTYTVSFDANGGEGAPDPCKKTYGEKITLPAQLLTREDYLFLGWATEPDADTAAYHAGDSYNLEGNVTLYAVWRPYSYKITFDANGGRNAPASVWKIKGTDLAISDKKPQLTGYVFLGWAYAPDAVTPDLRPGDLYTRNEELTLYAVWGQDCYVLSFDANGGEGAPSDQIKEQDTVLTLSDRIPTREGYSFQGWASTPDAETEEYLPGGTYDLEGENTLYAVWTINSYYLTVQYVYEDGMEAAEPYIGQLEYGSSFRVESPLIDMSTASDSAVEGVMQDGNLDLTVTYFWAPRENRVAVITGVGNVSSTSFTVSGASYAGDGTLYYGVSLTDRAEDVTDWQTAPSFSGLDNETDYYVFVWVYGSTYYENAVSDPVLIHTASLAADSLPDPGSNNQPAYTQPPAHWHDDEQTVQTINLILPLILIGTGLFVILFALLLYRRTSRDR